MLCDKETKDDNDENLKMFSCVSKPIDANSNIVIEARKVLITKVQHLTIDVWMEYAEKTTKHLDLSSIPWWHDQDIFPSNYQLLIAHYCYELVNLAPDLKAVLSQFAREYKREYGKLVQTPMIGYCLLSFLSYKDRNST